MPDRLRQAVAERVGIRFRRTELLRIIFVDQDRAGIPPLPSRDELAYFGDAFVLRAARRFAVGQGMNGGREEWISHAVRNVSMAAFIRERGLDTLRVTRNNAPPSDHMLGDILEALAEATLMDRGHSAAVRFLCETYFPSVAPMLIPKTPPSGSRELLELMRLGRLERALKHVVAETYINPEWAVERPKNPGDPFLATVNVLSIVTGVGRGPTETEARINAAQDALTRIDSLTQT